MAKYLGQLLPGFCQVSTLPRNWGYSIVKYEKNSQLLLLGARAEGVFILFFL